LTEPARRLLILTAMELTRDPRARRQVAAAATRGIDVFGVSGTAGEEPVGLDGIDVVRVTVGGASGTLQRAGLGGFKYPSPFVRELRGAARIARLLFTTVKLVRAGRKLDRFDLVHANDFTTLPAGWLLTRGSNTRLVYDAHEVYASEEPDGPRIYRKFVAAAEGFLARRSNAVVTVSDPIADELTRTLHLPTKPTVVLNAPARDDRSPEPADESSPLAAVYQGAMGPVWSIEDLYTVAEHAAGVSLTIRVAGADHDSLEREVRRRGLEDRVHIARPVPPDQLVDALRPFEIGLMVHRAGTRSSELVFPNKLFEYMMAGLALGVPALPGMAPLLASEDIGVLYEPGHPEELGRKLTELAADRPRVTAMRKRAHRLALDHFNAEGEVQHLLSAWGLASVLPAAHPAP
jgi:glycosyltransferase involved in cell wall biosynthesis